MGQRFQVRVRYGLTATSSTTTQAGAFDLPAWLQRIGYHGPLQPNLDTLRSVITASSQAIPYENLDVLLGRPPNLDIASLQQQMVVDRRGGFCFQQALLLRAGLCAMGFSATGLLGRVVLGLPANAERLAGHGAVRVDLPEGPFLVDVGFGNLTPTAPLLLQPGLEQETPHETMRFLAVADELVLQARRSGEWVNLYRLCNHLPLDADFNVSNWFVSTHPNSLFVANLIAARPGPDRTRHTFLNGRVSLRRADGAAERTQLATAAEAAAVLRETFGLELPNDLVGRAWAELERRGRLAADHPFFQG
jgi:N-hydroxyarylamine O-acetyltransferase